MTSRRGHLGHADIWRALDAMAAARGLSASALARAAGLDPTAFNPSKRQSVDGRRRWPSTESLVRVLGALDMSLGAFAAIAEGGAPVAAGSSAGPATLRALPWSALDRGEAFDRAGLPMGRLWDEWASPIAAGPHAYAVHVDVDALHPVARRGAVLVMAPTASIRVGDRVFLRGVQALPPLAVVASLSAGGIGFSALVPGFDVAEGLHPRENLQIVHRLAAICF